MSKTVICRAKSKAFWWGFHICGRKKGHLGKHTCNLMIERKHEGSQKPMAPHHCNFRWSTPPTDKSTLTLTVKK